MKTLNIFSAILFVITSIFMTACSNNSAEIEELKAELEQLKKVQSSQQNKAEQQESEKVTFEVIIERWNRLEMLKFFGSSGIFVGGKP